jgi:hypothetical protein
MVDCGAFTSEFRQGKIEPPGSPVLTRNSPAAWLFIPFFKDWF